MGAAGFTCLNTAAPVAAAYKRVEIRFMSTCRTYCPRCPTREIPSEATKVSLFATFLDVAQVDRSVQILFSAKQELYVLWGEMNLMLFLALLGTSNYNHGSYHIGTVRQNVKSEHICCVRTYNNTFMHSV